MINCKSTKAIFEQVRKYILLSIHLVSAWRGKQSKSALVIFQRLYANQSSDEIQ